MRKCWKYINLIYFSFSWLHWSRLFCSWTLFGWKMYLFKGMERFRLCWIRWNRTLSSWLFWTRNFWCTITTMYLRRKIFWSWLFTRFEFLIFFIEFDESNNFLERCDVDCGPNGRCQNGECICHDEWKGPKCNERRCDARCSEHGQCKNGTCHCSQGWNGKHCTLGMLIKSISGISLNNSLLILIQMDAQNHAIEMVNAFWKIANGNVNVHLNGLELIVEFH